MAGEPDGYDCSQCPVAESLASLDYENRRAWELFHHVTSRFLIDMSACGVVFERLTREWDRDDVVDAIDRLRVLYDILCPPPERS